VWISVLGLSLVMAVHPLRLGVTLLVLSRPRPVQSLFVYWVGGLLMGFPALLVPLMVLHGTPVLRSFMDGLATPTAHAGAQHMQIGLGVLALAVATIMAVRFAAPQRSLVAATGGNAPTAVLDSNMPNIVSRLVGIGQGVPTEGGATIRRLLGRAHIAWKSGSLWVALAIGVVMGPSIDLVLAVLAIVVPSGAALGAQVGAVITFVVGMLAVVEIILVSYLVTPAKTQAALRRLHNWTIAQRRKIVMATFAAIGVLLVATGVGAV
jgi:Sap, sulfolipid-1-addressing protein